MTVGSAIAPLQCMVSNTIGQPSTEDPWSKLGLRWISFMTLIAALSGTSGLNMLVSCFVDQALVCLCGVL